MTIIAATDFSPVAANAARSAARLARKLGDNLQLVRVIEPPALMYPELAMTSLDSIEAALQSSARDQLQAAAAPLRGEGVEIETLVLSGVPDQVLAEHAAAQRARLIVMGTHGRHGAARFFLGSVAERTLREAHCPVLVLREGAAPFDAWAAGQRRLRVMVALDFSPASDAAWAWVKTLRGVAACDVTLVHRYWPPREHARLALGRDIPDVEPEIVTCLERDLRDHFGTLPGQGDVSLRVRAGWERTADSLAGDAEEGEADLLVVGTHQPHGWERIRGGSVAVGTLRSSHVPLLCVPAAAGAAIHPDDLPPAPRARADRSPAPARQ